MLDVKNIDVYYDDAQALWDVSFSVNHGEIVTLVGSNGAGKSTTLKAISGLVPPSSGEIRLEGNRIDRVRAHSIVEMGIAQIPEGRRLWPGLSVQENLELGAYIPAARAVRGETMEWVFQLFPLLRERRSQLAGTLSGGERQMLALGKALMGQPKLLILDEPFGGLNPAESELVAKSLTRLHKGGRFGRLHSEGPAMLIIEHKLRELMKIIDRVIVINFGEIIAQGTPEEISKNKQVIEAYTGKEVLIA